METFIFRKQLQHPLRRTICSLGMILNLWSVPCQATDEDVVKGLLHNLSNMEGCFEEKVEVYKAKSPLPHGGFAYHIVASNPFNSPTFRLVLPIHPPGRGPSLLGSDDVIDHRDYFEEEATFTFVTKVSPGVLQNDSVTVHYKVGLGESATSPETFMSTWRLARMDKKAMPSRPPYVWWNETRYSDNRKVADYYFLLRQNVPMPWQSDRAQLAGSATFAEEELLSVQNNSPWAAYFGAYGLKELLPSPLSGQDKTTHTTNFFGLHCPFNLNPLTQAYSLSTQYQQISQDDKKVTAKVRVVRKVTKRISLERCANLR